MELIDTNATADGSCAAPSGKASPRRAGARRLVAVTAAVAVAGLAMFGMAGVGFAATAPAATAAAAADDTTGSGMTGDSTDATSTDATTADDTTADDTATADASGDQIDIAIQNYAFVPATVTVKVGDTVTWTNKDAVAHTVTISSGPVTFSSQNLATGESFTYTFTTAGTYEYYCAIHPGMTATVTVGGDSTTPPATTTCIPKDVAAAILAHIKAAHLEMSPGDQVKGALDADSYVRMHTEWLEKVLDPIVDGGPTVVSQMIAAIMAHIDAAHLETSLGDQVKGLLNADDYVLMHTEWLEKVLAPAVDQMTC